MITLFMRLWCITFGHSKVRYTVRNGKVVQYCVRCGQTVKLDSRGSLW